VKLLTISGNPKTDKGEALGYWTAILHLAPAKLSGFEVCPKASAGCRAACLNTAGHGGLAKGGKVTYETLTQGTRTNAVQLARILRTQKLFLARADFMRQLAKEIAAHVKRCRKAGFTPAIRLNGTSDIRWEASGYHIDGRSIFDWFPEVQFYDYTKIANRRNLPANYALTFSYADGNRDDVVKAIAGGLNVAVVFRDKATRARYMGEGFMGLPVIDGDETDLRFLDPTQVVVGLYAKGDAKRDTSGFVAD
jgi:hypothetical protein